MFDSALMPAYIVLLALALDWLLGEPARLHPLVGFGNLANWLEAHLNQPTQTRNRLGGALALTIAVAPVLLVLTLPAYFFSDLWWLEALVLYLAIGRKSLMQHAVAVIKPLQQNNLPLARQKLSYIVSRDTAQLDHTGIVKASIETVIENSNDAIFAPLFWFLLAGIPGVVLYRLVNTLDAMWGYKNARFLQFGWAAARLDDVLNWIPARLTVISFACFRSFSAVVCTAFAQGKQCSSPNAGPVMAAGASALKITLGGEAIYQGVLISKPVLGFGNSPQLGDIQRAMQLVNHTVMLWCFGITLAVMLPRFIY